MATMTKRDECDHVLRLATFFRPTPTTEQNTVPLSGSGCT
jgi:hypothetical protein